MLIIDRFEEEWVVIEQGRKTFNLPRSLLPSEAQEGDVLKLQIIIDRAATKKRKQVIQELTEELFIE
ncbi:MAG: DUF3006 domain-containing protein [Syntrophomonadaceae bacterium]|nr:DUF3006 domain-containing protein [Syntrophomonadaceae bacterium]